MGAGGGPKVRPSGADISGNLPAPAVATLAGCAKKGAPPNMNHVKISPSRCKKSNSASSL